MMRPTTLSWRWPTEHSTRSSRSRPGWPTPPSPGELFQASGFEEGVDQGCEPRWFLEQESVRSVRVEDQSRGGNEPGEGAVVGDRVDPVGRAVGDQGRHG